MSTTPAVASMATARSDERTAPSVSVVMPCLNEEATVGVCVEKAMRWLATSGRPGEVVVVDNGSTDRSVELAEAAGARVFHERRRGYGQAYLRGFAEARGDYIVMGDSDDTYDFPDLGRLIAPLTRRRHGDRQPVRGRDRPGAMPWAHRYIGTPISTSSSASSSANGSATARAGSGRSADARTSRCACAPPAWSSPPR